MKVGVPLHFVRAGKITGVERYGIAVIKGAAAARLPDDELHALATPVAATEVEGAAIITRLPGEWRLLGEQIALPAWAARSKLDLLHVPAFGGAVLRKTPFVLTVHDDVFWSQPSRLSRLGRLYYRPMVERALASRLLRRVVFVSASARDDVLRHFPQLAERSRVAYAATTLEPRDVPRRWQDRRDGPFRVLSVGTVEPRKNLAGMCRAVEQLRAELGKPVVWSHVGRRAWVGAEEASLLDSGVVNWLGVVEDAVLIDLYRDADVLISLSHAEGFNIPLVESMAQGTPVVASDLPVHREVGGTGADYVVPSDHQSTTSTLRRLLSDPELWNERSESAHSRGREFTPAALGTRLWEIYRDAHVRS